MVSASNATEPEIVTTTTCAAAVTARTIRLVVTARMPWALDSSAESTVGCVVGVRSQQVPDQTLERPPAIVVVLSVVVRVVAVALTGCGMSHDVLPGLELRAPDTLVETDFSGVGA
jgi:hypothetical protein